MRYKWVFLITALTLTGCAVFPICIDCNLLLACFPHDLIYNYCVVMFTI